MEICFLVSEMKYQLFSFHYIGVTRQFPPTLLYSHQTYERRRTHEVLNLRQAICSLHHCRNHGNLNITILVWLPVLQKPVVILYQLKELQTNRTRVQISSLGKCAQIFLCLTWQQSFLFHHECRKQVMLLGKLLEGLI